MKIGSDPLLVHNPYHDVNYKNINYLKILDLASNKILIRSI